MKPEILISSSCWRRMSDELDRVYPAEGVMVPLVGLELAAAEASPCAMIELEEIRRLVIARIVRVPPRLQVNRSVRVHVLPRTNALVNARIEGAVRRHPRLRACAYLHSHPFAVGSTWPSRGPGCDYEGHILPLWQHNRRAGLNTSFSFIACQRRRGGWRLQAFALADEERIVDLGRARVIADDSPLVRRALAPGLWNRPVARAIWRRWRRELRGRGFSPRSEELFDGWQRMTFELGAGRRGVALVPPEFPEVLPRLYAVGARGEVSRAELSSSPPATVRSLVATAEAMKGDLQ